MLGAGRPGNYMECYLARQGVRAGRGVVGGGEGVRDEFLSFTAEAGVKDGMLSFTAGGWGRGGG